MEESNTGHVNTCIERTRRHVQDRSAKNQIRTPVLVDDHVLPSDENLPPSNFSTPSSVRFKDALASATPRTPRHRVRLAGKLLTPQSSRSSLSSKSQTVYSQARHLFTHASNGKVIGREAERSQLSKFISEALETRTGGCTYVSGPPGTGKSALVQEVMHDFEDEPVQIATINCVSLKSASEVLVHLSKTFGSTKPGLKSPKPSLAKLFTAKSGPKMHLVLLDEIDTLLNNDCDVLCSIFEWAMHPTSSLVLIGIANALDLTDRFLPRLKLRNVKPRLLPFLPYSAQQISAIITGKLQSLLPGGTTSGSDFVPLMHPAAIQLAGKKISSQTGDLRKAFSLVRRTVDQIEQETLLKMGQQHGTSPTKDPLREIRNIGSSPAFSPPTKTENRSELHQLTFESAPRASIAHVAKIAANIFNNGTTSRLSGLNLQQRAVLCTLVASEARKHLRDPYSTPSKSGSKVPSIKELFEKYAALCKRDDGLLQPLKSTEFRDVVASLETLGLVHQSAGRASSFLTPTNTPSRGGRGGIDEKQVASAVSEKEMRDSLTGPGSDLLLRLLDEQ